MQADRLTVSSNQLMKLSTSATKLTACKSAVETSRMGTAFFFDLLLFALVMESVDALRASECEGRAKQCEGYWPPAKVCLPLGTAKPNMTLQSKENEGCPQWRIDPDWDRDQGTAFLQKLNDIEKTAMDADATLARVTVDDLKSAGLDNVSWVNLFRFRGLSPSRLVETGFVNSSEYIDIEGKDTACWPAGYLSYYIERYHVVPEHWFQDYVQTFDLPAFRKAIRTLTAFQL